MENRIQIILETIEKIVEFKEEPKQQPPSSMRKRREQRGRRRFTKPVEPKKRTATAKAALLAAIEHGDKDALLAAVSKFRRELEQD